MRAWDKRAVASRMALALLLALPGLASTAPISHAAAASRAAAVSVKAVSRATAVLPAAAVSRATDRPAVQRAPTGPPLNAIEPSQEAESTAGVPSGTGDPLVENGLSSPLCKSSRSGELSSAAQSNCQTSGFLAAPAPTGNYGLDVNIDVGPFGLSKGGLLSVIQDVFIAPLWDALVWVVHALAVMLEWCYTLELLGGPTMSAIAGSLREAQASFTEPWLVLVLAVASVLAAYDGLIRRRVADALGHALATIAMMAVGLWVIADPLGTVGALGRWANQASLGTFGAVAQGTPANAPRTLADSLRALFSNEIEAPWCYLEFGNVRWCDEPALLDSSLRKVALSIAAEGQAKLACSSSLDRSRCASKANAPALAVQHTEDLLREADTNGRLFTAFPANRSERNSVKDAKSLLHVLCQSEDDTKCTGPTAAQAEFRSDSGTFARMIGVALIAIGLLGMVMLFGLLALHLLAAAAVSLFLLLLAPFVVLAPALGDSGRSIFLGWLTRLLGAVSSKLIFSFLLGVLLGMQRLLMSLQPLGWWTQWLLISAFWWTVFLKRHQLQTLLQSRGRQSHARHPRPFTRRVEGARQAQRMVRRPLRWARDRVLSPVPVTEQLDREKQATGRRRKALDGRTAVRAAHAPLARESEGSARAPDADLAKQAQLERVRDAHQTALAQGDRRRAAKLAARAQRINAELAHEHAELAHEHAELAHEQAQGVGPAPAIPGRRAPRQAGSEQTLPPFTSVSSSGGRPAFRHSAFQHSVSGHPPFKRGAVEPADARHAQPSPLNQDERSDRRTDRAPGSRPLDRPTGAQTPSDGVETGPPGSPAGHAVPGPGADRAQAAGQQRSAVIEDVRAVVEGRKRQLGYGSKE